MKRAMLLLTLLGLAGPAAGTPPIYLIPDVPTDNPANPTQIFLPWEIVRYSAAASPAYTSVLRLPDQTPLDALYRLGSRGRWLFSVETPTLLPPDPSGSPGAQVYEPEDVFLYDQSTDPPTYSMYFDGSLAGVPPGANVDAALLDDTGGLVLSFEAPTTLGGVTYDPSDLVRYTEAGFEMAFDASASGAGIAASSNVRGADRCRGPSPNIVEPVVLSFDVPTDLAPSVGPPTYVAGQIAYWDGAAFGLWVQLPGWPASSLVVALSCRSRPGRVSGPITLDKISSTPGNLVIRWPPSCASGGEDFSIYEGNLMTLQTEGYTHKNVVCTDAGSDLMEDITPQAGNRYYLVVPHDYDVEGSYGQNSQGIERPQPKDPAARCHGPQDVTPCPP